MHDHQSVGLFDHRDQISEVAVLEMLQYFGHHRGSVHQEPILELVACSVELRARDRAIGHG